MPIDFGILLPLWSIAAGDDDLLERAAGEIGVTHLTAPVVTGPLTRFRLHSGGGPHYFHTEGGWHFPPRGELYSSRTVRPRTAAWFGRKNPLTRLADESARRGLPWIARIEPRAVPALLAHAPHLATVNEWGEPELGGGPCLLNPDFGELLRELMEDIKGYSVAGIELAGWSLESSHPFKFAATGWDEHRRQLLNLCFCPACRRVAERAGADPDATARAVQVGLNQLLAAESDSRVDLDPLITQYAAAREQDARAWLTRFAAHVPGRRFLAIRSAANPAAGQIPPEWVPLRLLDHEPVATAIAEAAAAATAVSIPGCRPWVESADALFAFVRSAASNGVRYFDFVGLDEAPSESIDWTRRAVRFVRREFDE